jgi:sortase A
VYATGRGLRISIDRKREDGCCTAGQQGWRVAGHRVGRGAPFLALGELHSCDSIVVETARSWFVYRVLPMAGETTNWASTSGQSPRCTDSPIAVTPPTGLYSDVVGREIVAPRNVGVIAAVPDHPKAAIAATDELALLTLTACNPKFSARQRMIVHATLVRTMPKDGGAVPPEMTEG